MKIALNIAVVIVNYKTGRLVVDCLKSLLIEIKNEKNISYMIYIVDNHSQDDSVSIIRNYIVENQLENFTVIINADTNGGFAYGNNKAFRAIFNSPIISDYVWLLNSDTLIHENSGKELIDFMETHQKVGIAGSRLEDPDGTPQVSAFNDFSVLGEMLAGFRLSILSNLFKNKVVAPKSIPTIPVMTDWVAGASMMIRADLLINSCQFDEKYFLYYEEVDLCLNARRKGWECWYVPSSKVIHLVGASSGISDLRKKAPRRPIYWFESRRYFFRKNYGLIKHFLADSLFILGYLTFRLRKLTNEESLLEPPYFLKDFIKNSCLVGKKK